MAMQGLVASGSAVLALLVPVISQAQEGDWRKLPLAVVCKLPTSFTIGYLSEVRDDGGAVFISADGRIAASVEPDGSIKPAGDLVNDSCTGRTLEELRSDGMTIEMPD